MKKRIRERMLLWGLAKDTAEQDGVPFCKWCDLKGISTQTFHNHACMPNLDTIYRVCDAVGIRPSDFFRLLGR